MGGFHKWITLNKIIIKIKEAENIYPQKVARFPPPAVRHSASSWEEIKLQGIKRTRSPAPTRGCNDVRPRFDELPGYGRELRDALLVVDEAVGSKDAAMAVIGVRTEANVAGDEEVRKVAG